MATPPREGWDGEHERAKRRTRRAEADGWDSWAAWVEALEEEKGYPICGRPKNSDKAPCRKKAGTGTDHLGVGACKTHGGSNPRGKSHPTYVHGERVQGWELHYPEGLQAHVDEARATSQLQRLREVVDMVSARLAQKVDEIRRREDPQRPAAFRATLDELLEAVRAGDAQRVANGLREMQAMADAAADEAEQWQEVDRLADRFAAHLRTQWGILKEMRVLVQLDMVEDRLRMMVGEVRRAVEEEVSDEQERYEVLRRVAHATRAWAESFEQSMTSGAPGARRNGDGGPGG